jgi:hypothetical protein
MVLFFFYILLEFLIYTEGYSSYYCGVGIFYSKIVIYDFTDRKNKVYEVLYYVCNCVRNSRTKIDSCKAISCYVVSVTE